MKKWLYRILMLICVGVFAFSAYQLYLIYSSSKQVEDETAALQEYVIEEDYLQPDWASLQAENPDIIAWVYVPGCNISFPVVQGDDNSYYLTHTTKNEYNERGAIFLDYQANPSFTDNNSIIYGHSVEGGGMFTDLKNYSDQTFFSEHPVFYLLTPNANYECQIMTYAKSNDGSVYYTTSFGGYRDDVINQMKTNALYYNDIDTTDKSLVTLSTCDLDYGFNSNRRLILTGVLNQITDPIKIID